MNNFYLISNIANVATEIIVERNFDSCASGNRKYVEIEKITNEQMINSPNNSCSQEVCSPTNLTYTVTVNGKEIKTLIQYSIRRAIYMNGKYRKKVYFKNL
jgi:hypothetical protein